jgi:hypothetical protein
VKPAPHARVERRFAGFGSMRSFGVEVLVVALLVLAVVALTGMALGR